jgi:hypothetical protein
MGSKCTTGKFHIEDKDRNAQIHALALEIPGQSADEAEKARVIVFLKRARSIIGSKKCIDELKYAATQSLIMPMSGSFMGRGTGSA